ncbi:MAG: hypothetical protein C0612_05635 [Desulfobulbaceae bacterium]|nr:MAG: hypothetical protein C0612_05635 [Desulfobulbaceae bacterium]
MNELKHQPVRQPTDLNTKSLRKKMLLNMRRAVYTFTALLSSKNDKKGATGKVQLLLLFNGAETRI